MADRVDYFFKQRVTEAELDLGFELLERADRNLAADLGFVGVLANAAVTPHAPVPDLTADVSGPGIILDQLGQRIFFAALQNVDLAHDANGVATEVTAAGKERIVSVFAQFDRVLSDPRVDGNSQTVNFRRDESFKLVVTQGPEATAGTAAPPPLRPDAILLADVTRSFGQTQVLAAGISIARRQDAVVAGGSPRSLRRGRVIEALRDLLALYDAHVSGTADHHAAAGVDVADAGAWADGTPNPPTTLEARLTKLIADVAGVAGARRVGAAATAGLPNALAQGSVKSQLDALLGFINGHVTKDPGAHAASAIAYAGGDAWRDGTANPATTVAAQFGKVVADLGAVAGALRIGADATAGSPTALVAGSVKGQLDALLVAVNKRVTPTDLASVSPAGAGLVGAAAVAGSPSALGAGTVASQLAALLALVNARARIAGEAFTGDLLPSATGLVLGSAAARWNAFLRDVNALASAAGVAAVHGYSADASTPALIGSGAGAGTWGLNESDAIEASHQSLFGTKVWDLVKGWTFLPQHTGDIPDAVEINGVTQRNIVKAWGSVTSAGVLQSPHWNVASVTRLGTGRYVITLDVNPGSRHAVVATVVSSAITADYSIHAYSPDAITFGVVINSAGSPSDQAFTFVVLGA